MMTSRERILAAINHQPVDRVPTDIWATDEVWAMLAAKYGSTEQAMVELHIDGIADIRPDYIGPPFKSQCPPDAGIDFKNMYGIWGANLKWLGHDSGRYLEQSSIPMADVETIDDLADFPWPNPDWFDYQGFAAKAKASHAKQAVMCGYMSPIYVHQLVRGMENSMMDVLAEPELTHFIVGKICDYMVEYHRRIFEACADYIDISQVTDDLGSQSGPLFSMDTYHEFYAPQHRRFMKLCREFDIKVFHHDDGSMRAFLPGLIESGIDILNPVQWTCPGMELEGLKTDFGKHLCFHGGVENQRILPFGTPEDVRREVRNCIDVLARDRTGYILAPCHNLQSNTPMENIIALYDEAWNHGKF
jgi:uroporphyrinogen decarboxylase